jgi:hypothetical protein
MSTATQYSELVGRGAETVELPDGPPVPRPRRPLATCARVRVQPINQAGVRTAALRELRSMDLPDAIAQVIGDPAMLMPRGLDEDNPVHPESLVRWQARAVRFLLAELGLVDQS